MLELIDRQAALKKMCETCGYCEKFEKSMRETHPDFVTDKCNNYKFLAELPTIEPEVRHGRWEIIDKNANVWQCTTCGEEWMLNDGNPSDNYMLFCPHCGARMDGGADNG